MGGWLTGRAQDGVSCIPQGLEVTWTLAQGPPWKEPSLLNKHPQAIWLQLPYVARRPREPLSGLPLAGPEKLAVVCDPHSGLPPFRIFPQEPKTSLI